MSYCIPNVRRVWWFPLLAVVVCWTTFVAETGGMAFASTGQSGSGQPKFSLAPVYVDPGNPESLAYFIMNTRAGTLVQNALAEALLGVQTTTNPVSPVLVINGPVRTQMRAKAFPGEDPMTLPAPEDVVPLFLDLVSPQCTFNGCVVSFREWQKPKLSVPANSDE